MSCGKSVISYTRQRRGSGLSDNDGCPMNMFHDSACDRLLYIITERMS